MRRNKDPRVPCHRVVLSSGRLGGYNRGVGLKAKILKKEGVKIKGGKIDLSVYTHRFD